MDILQESRLTCLQLHSVDFTKQITSSTSHRESGKRKARRPGAQSKGRKELKLLKEEDTISKDRWIEIMCAAGFSDDDMHDWHRQFERLEPDAQQEFLESLGIGSDEIQAIRERFKR